MVRPINGTKQPINPGISQGAQTPYQATVNKVKSLHPTSQQPSQAKHSYSIDKTAKSLVFLFNGGMKAMVVEIKNVASSVFNRPKATAKMPNITAPVGDNVSGLLKK